MDSSWLVHTLNILSNSKRSLQQVVTPDSSTAVRVGRNDVWRIQQKRGDSPTYYAKYWNSKDYFQRELLGLRLMQNLAAQNDWIMAAEVEYISEPEGLIVTKQLSGCSFRHILESAFRVDKILSFGRAGENKAAVCLHTILDLLDLLHDQHVNNPLLLEDHGIDATMRRINRNLSRVHSIPDLSSQVYIGQLPKAIQICDQVDDLAKHLLFGDPSPDNIFFDGNRIGLIDFEDLGTGPSFRDSLLLHYHLELTSNRLQYDNISQLLSIIKYSHCLPIYRLIYMLDFTLSHLLLLKNLASARNTWRKVINRLEISRFCYKLLNIYNVACLKNAIEPQ